MARLSICLFGPFRVTLDGEPVAAFESDKVRALLAYLAVEAEVPHRREKLAGLFWPDWPERAAHANLSRALTNLRQSIGDREATPPILFASRQAIQFNRVGDAWVDVTAFLDLAGHRDLSGLTQAVDLYRGPFLEGFSLSGCPGFEEWALFEGERLQRLALQALGRLSEWYEKDGELEPALQHAWRQVELSPWQESAHRQVMRLLARTGQRGAAIAHYETCRRYLADELGVGPSAETVALSEQIRQETLAPRPSATPVHNLRAPLTPFVGREAELFELGQHLCDPACRLLTLVGPGGIGKTRLAIEAARIHMDRFTHGVFQVRLVGLQSVEAIVPTIAESIGFSFYRRGDAKQQLLDYLSSKRMLLVLDNFEHLLAGVEIVIDLLHAAPGVTVVITSRTRLNLQGEHLFLVDGMAVPPLEVEVTLSPSASLGTGRASSPAGEREELENVAEYDAVKLFVSGAHRVCPGFRLADQAAQVSRVCRLADGMPLAILLASSRVDTLSPAEIAARIGQDLDLLEAGWRDVPKRHRSVRAAFDHSWKLLTEREQGVFGALSVFRGGFDQEAAQTVSGATTGDLWRLADQSFLHRLPMGRYEVHELLRQYGADRLHRAETPEGALAAWEAAHERHCGYYTAALERWGEDLKGARQQVSLAEMDVEIENARAAWSWAAERRQVARLEQALEGLCLFYEWRVRYQEGETACRLAVERLAPEAAGSNLSVFIELLIWQGAFNRLLERGDSAAQLLAESEDLLVGRDLPWERAFLLLQKGHMALHSDREEAARLHGQSAALFRAVGNDWWAATVLREQGRVAFYRGVYTEARLHLEQCLALRRALGDQRGIADALDGLGILATFQGHLEKAVGMLREAAAILRGTGNRLDYGGVLCNLSMTLAVAGKLDEGHSVMEACVVIHNDLGQNWFLALCRGLLGFVKVYLGRYEEALAQSNMASTLSQELGYWRGLGLACWVRGSVALAREAYAQAQYWLQESAALQRRIQQWDDLGYALSLLGSASRGLGQLSDARRYLQEAIGMAAKAGSFAIVSFALPVIPPLLADQGQGERAVELYALAASRIPVVSNSPWYEEIAGRHVAAVAASLPPDVVAAAQARGRARDLWATVAELVDELGD